MTNFKEQLNRVKASGELLRTSNTRDGYAVHKAIQQGFPVAIISGGKRESVRERFKGIGVTDIYLGTNDKVDAMEDFRFKYGLELSEILYMGDDLPDFEVMQRVGFPTCPADAAPEIVAISHYVSNYSGGKGCVRDVIEQVLKLKGVWLIDKNFKQ